MNEKTAKSNETAPAAPEALHPYRWDVIGFVKRLGGYTFSLGTAAIGNSPSTEITIRMPVNIAGELVFEIDSLVRRAWDDGRCAGFERGSDSRQDEIDLLRDRLDAAEAKAPKKRRKPQGRRVPREELAAFREHTSTPKATRVDLLRSEAAGMWPVEEKTEE